MRGLSPTRARRAVIVAALALAPFGAQGPRGQEPPPAAAGALDRAAALVAAGSYDGAADLLAPIVAADPGNRRARELLAFVMEARGDLDGERRLRAALARDYPGDPAVLAAYGRVLERSGSGDAALAVYRRARALRPAAPEPDLDAAIERTRGITAVEVGTPVLTLDDPDASGVRAQAGVALPFGPPGHVVVTAARLTADGRHDTPETATGDLLGASLVLRHPSGATLTTGPRLHAVRLQEGALADRAVGGVLAARGPLGRHLSADFNAAYDLPWDEAAVSILHGGRVSSAESHLYLHAADRRLLLQAGAQERRLSILVQDPASADPGAAARPEASQSLWVAGADAVLWRKPRPARGEILDDALVAPAALPTALVLGYRHYEVSTRTDPEFGAVIDLASAGSVDEVSTTLSLGSPGGRFGVEFRGGFGRDAARDARLARAGGSLVWAPLASMRLTVGYDEATDLMTGLTGRRHAGLFSLHVDL